MWFKRVGKVILLLGAAGALLVTGGTLALFFASTGVQSRSLASGSIALGAPATTMINVAGLVPGASGQKTYTVTYTGNAPAWLGVIANVTGDLATCDGGKLQMLLAADGAPTITYRWNQPSPEVVRTGGTPEAPVAAPVNTGATKTFRVGYTLPIEASNDCQSKTAEIQLQVVAVQSEFNTNATNNGPISWGTGSAPPPPPSLVLDQSNTGALLATTSPAGDFGQLFTAGRSGALEKVRIGIYGVPLSDVTVTIQAVNSGGEPSGTILATTTIPRGSLPSTLSTPPALVDAVFALPATVSAGTQYAIVLTEQSGLQMASTGDLYAGGLFVFHYAFWYFAPGSDMFFETYVNPASPPPPPSLRLDQRNTGVMLANGTPFGEYGQVFTAGRSGALEKVRIGIYGTADSEVTVTIRTLDAGLPSGTILATTTIIPADVPHLLSTPPAFADAIFARPATVTDGTQYAIVVTRQPYVLVPFTVDQYAGGALVFYYDGGWQVDTMDMHFETYVR